MGSDFVLVVFWWAVLFLFGIVTVPVARLIFYSWWDHGYGLSKALGIVVTTYSIWLLASVHILPFTQMSVILILTVIFFGGLAGFVYISSRKKKSTVFEPAYIQSLTRPTSFRRILSEEILFFVCLLFWSWVKGHEASIRSLEKFMDFGFTKSILNSFWFPAPDMWYAGETINYYTFGHTMLAVLTKFSGIDLSYTFNLMLATLFALCATMSFTIGVQLMLIGLREYGKKQSGSRQLSRKSMVRISLAGGFLSAFLVTLGGNLQTIYAFGRGYIGEDVKPFWTLWWNWGDWQGLLRGINDYWYANATRFIPFTIHEFPGYSFVVSDIHGMVLSIPLVLLTFAFLVHMFVIHGESLGKKSKLIIVEYSGYAVYGVLVSTLFMTNALDGPIYAGLFVFCILLVSWKNNRDFRGFITTAGIAIGIMIFSFVVASLPFFLSFHSFVNGIGVNCPIPPFENTKIGPLLFEGVEKCQRSPLWMFLIIWGFFLYNGVWFVLNRYNQAKQGRTLTRLDSVFILIVIYCIGLLIFPEFFYFKDIYPAHFRSNTMFKLGYQVFIMMSLLSGYVIVYFWNIASKFKYTRVYIAFLLPQLFLVSLYPILATRTYYHRLSEYEGLYGFFWMTKEYPFDKKAIDFLNTHIRDGSIYMGGKPPVLVEAEGESYTDHSRFSALTGIPAVVGWPVHEWLWRGTYDVVAPRVEDVKRIYTTQDMTELVGLIHTYDVEYIIVGELERRKYTAIPFHLYLQIAHPVYEYGQTTIYRVNEG